MWKQIAHNGYGALYNSLYVSEDGKQLLKQTNDYADGRKKLDNEKGFYQFLQNNTITFPVPYVHEFGANFMIMDYLQDYVPLYQVFPTWSDTIQRKVLLDIHKHLECLHQTTKIVDKAFVESLVYDETHVKVLQRFQDVQHILMPYNRIQKVNGLSTGTFEDLMHTIDANVRSFVNTLPEHPSLHLIHGDCQFHNILYHPTEHTIMFIDPRGYFGTSRLYGLKEYDDAKVLFALSGYDFFDSLDVTPEKLVVHESGTELTLDIQEHLTDIIMSAPLCTRTFMVSIWLGNAHSFVKSNPLKAVYSYFLALYMGAKFLK